MINSRYLYNSDTLPLLSILKLNKTQASLSDELSLLLKHTTPSVATHTHSIIIIKDTIKPLDIETWTKKHIKNESPTVEPEEIYQQFIADNSIHVLSVKNLHEIDKCLDSILASIQGMIHTPPEATIQTFTVCIEGIDKFWDNESFLLHENKRFKMPIVNEIFLKLRLFRDISESWGSVDIRTVLVLNQRNNVIANRHVCDFEGFVESYMINAEVLDMTKFRLEINKRVYSNNV